MNTVVKYISALFVALCGLFFSASAQDTATKVPISIYFPESYEDIIPANAQVQLANKLTGAAAKAGVGATTDFTQFYLTCGISVLDSQIIPGAPTQYSQQLEITMYVVDALAKKIFNSISVVQRGTGKSVELAYNAAIRQMSVTNKDLKQFFIATSKKIISYYDAQYKTIIQKAQALVAAQKYDEALFTLSVVPESCAGYSEVVDVATVVYLQYVDDQAHKKLAKAKAIWSSGMDSASAYEAGMLLAEIPENAKCYAEAVTLQNEMKLRVTDDIRYERELLAKREDVAAEISKLEIAAWKAVGLAYGNNQKAHTYNNAWVVPGR